MTKPVAIVLAGDGINCDAETAYALELVGFEAKVVHVSDLLGRAQTLTASQLLVLPGGFSYGDEIASGKVLAIKLRERLQNALYDYIDSGNMVLGICNGFQVLVQLGLLPDSVDRSSRLVSLIRNSHRRFVNQWVKLKVSADCGRFFANLSEIELPIRHGEGRLALDSAESQDSFLVSQRAPLRYVDDVNGSFEKIAALTNEAGNVMGLMPHPEAFVRWTQFPAWTTRKAEIKEHEGSTDFAHLPHGLAIFRNALSSLN